MKLPQFEQELLFFVRNSTEPITSQNVAYYLKLTVEESQKHLEALVEKNILFLDSDDDGNMFFTIPNTPRKDNEAMLHKHFFPETVEEKQPKEDRHHRNFSHVSHNRNTELMGHELFMICPNPNCRYEGIAVKKQKGSMIVAVFLFFFYVIPGILYYIFGCGTRYYCPKCGMKINK